MSAAEFLPTGKSITALRKAAASCRACPLWRLGTQTVFGEGPRSPNLVIVGEQPGDQEDRAGHPFVGPAGALLDEALERAGIDRDDTYVTNAVKHFKWEQAQRGKRRIHKKPSAAEVRACHPWLDAELETLQPSVILALGATAAQSIFGPKTKVTTQRARILTTSLAQAGFVTVHPSSVLRSPSPEARTLAKRVFFSDIKAVAKYLGSMHPKGHGARS